MIKFCHQNHQPARDLWLLRKISDKQIYELKKQLKNKKQEDKKKKDFLICRICKNKITSASQMINVNGQHKHNFKNPAGIRFHIGCFSSAKGCLAIGNPTSEFTWFKGFTWCFASCSKCLVHMGWYYQSPGNSFFGLILNNLE